MKEEHHFLKNGENRVSVLPFVCYAGGPIQKPGKYQQARTEVVPVFTAQQ
jgi:hypothetical protein